MNTKIYYPAVFQKEDVGYSVWVPDINGCVSQGDTLKEAVDYITEAIGLCLETYLEHNVTPQKPTPPEDIVVEKGQFVSVIAFDILEYQKKYGTKAVKKTLTIPAWLNTLAEKNNVNFSSLLQTALMQELNLA